MKLNELHLHWRSYSHNDKKYYSYSLAKSVWVNGTCRKKIAVKLGKLSDNEVASWKKTLADAKTRSALSSTESDHEYVIEPSENNSFKLTNVVSELNTRDLSVAEENKEDHVDVKKFSYSEINQSNDIQSYEKAIAQAFEDVMDPRVDDNSRYPFYGLLLMILAATLGGATSITAIFEYAKEKAGIYCPLLNINRYPSYMAFWWILTRTNAEKLNQAFMNWLRTVADTLEDNNNERVIAIDGKTVRGAKNSLVHFVSGYDCTRGLLLGQKKTEEKSNEITAIPELLKVIDVKGAVVTIDAMGCQKQIVKDIRDRGGDYIIALKGNQEKLHAEAQNFFSQAREAGYKGASCRKYTSTNKGHGRIEKREVVITQNLKWLGCRKEWKDLKALIEVKSTRTVKGVTTEELRYYISSKSMKVKEANDSIRSHWGIENQLHWVLDVLFNDDGCRANAGQAAENLALFRRMAYCLLKQETVKGRGLASMQRKAMWNDSFVLELLGKFIKDATAEKKNQPFPQGNS